METNDLKKFIELNRNDFEANEFQADDWDAIANRLDQIDEKKRNITLPIRYVLRVAVVVVFLLCGGIYSAWNSWNQQAQNIMMISEVEETSQYYNNLIAIKVAEISRIDQTATDEVFQDMEMLNVAFSELKNDLADNADNEEVINAMINNHKIKLEILEQILNQLKDKQDL